MRLSMRSVLTVLAVTTGFVGPLTAEAKTLYVNGATGNDSTTYASNDANNPWQTIARAAWGSTNYLSPNPGQAAQEGDTVLIAAGTYWEKGFTVAEGAWRFSVSLNPANSGSIVATVCAVDRYSSPR